MPGHQLLVPGLPGLQTGVHDLAVEVDVTGLQQRDRIGEVRGRVGEAGHARDLAPDQIPHRQHRLARVQPDQAHVTAGPDRLDRTLPGLAAADRIEDGIHTVTAGALPDPVQQLVVAVGQSYAAAGATGRHPTVHPLGEEQHLDSLSSQNFQQQQPDRPGAQHQGRAARSDAGPTDGAEGAGGRFGEDGLARPVGVDRVQGPGVDHHQLGVAAVHVAAEQSPVRAHVGSSGTTDGAATARPQGVDGDRAAELEAPVRRHPGAVRVHDPDQLVAEHQPGVPQPVGPPEPAELGPADPRLGDAHPHLAGSRLRVREIDQLEPADLGEDQGTHQVNSLVAPSCIFWAASAGVSLLLNS